MDIMNIFYEFFTGAPTDPEQVLDYAIEGNISGVRQIHRWYGNKVWTIKNETNKNVMKIALSNRDKELVRFCVMNGAPVRFADLRYALENGLVDIFRIMVECEKERELSGSSTGSGFVERDTMETILMKALRLGDLESAQFLLPFCSPTILNQKSNSGDTALKIIVIQKFDKFLVHFLRHGGATLKLHRADANGWTALHYAVQVGSENMIGTLLKAGASPNATLFNGKTPLHLAAEMGDQLVISKILKHFLGQQGGSEAILVVEASDRNGNLPHHYFFAGLRNLNRSKGPDDGGIIIEEGDGKELLESAAEDIQTVDSVPLSHLEQVSKNFRSFFEVELKNMNSSPNHLNFPNLPNMPHERMGGKYCRTVFMKNKQGQSVFDFAKNFPQLMEILVEYIPRKFNSYMETLASKKKLRLQVCSDLHIEFGQKTENLIQPAAPYLVLLGDIGVVKKKNDFRKFIHHQASRFEKVFFVPGNHEFYGSSAEEAFESLRSICAEQPNIVFLHREMFQFPEHKFTILGTPLWTYIPNESQLAVQNLVSDYSKIYVKGGDYPFNPSKGKEPEGTNRSRLIRADDMNHWHREELDWLKQNIFRFRQMSFRKDVQQETFQDLEIITPRGDDGEMVTIELDQDTPTMESKAQDRRLIVLTHHSPVKRMGCGNPETWEGDVLCAFQNDLADLMGDHIALWAYGHTHWFHDMYINGTRVVSNPSGYPPSKTTKSTSKVADSSYDPSFVVDL